MHILYMTDVVLEISGKGNELFMELFSSPQWEGNEIRSPLN